MINIFSCTSPTLSMHDCGIKVSQSFSYFLRGINSPDVVYDYSIKASQSFQCKMGKVTALKHSFFQKFTYFSRNVTGSAKRGLIANSNNT